MWVAASTPTVTPSPQQASLLQDYFRDTLLDAGIAMHAATPRGSPSRRGRSPKSRTDSPSPIQQAGTASSQAIKTSATFISSLSIPVEGAVRIEPDNSEGSTPSRADQRPLTSDSRRAPRKSKTEALAALHSHAQSLSTDGEDPSQQDSAPIFPLLDAPIPVSSVFDLTTVKTSSPRFPPSRTAPRPFGLADCPVFYPTVDEFKDPMAYVRTISVTAKHYGICKVVPPPGWNMPFVTDTETFRFKTRLQRLNSIEASSRAKVNFLEQLYRWHKQQGNVRVAVPTINNKPLDLWLLRKEVSRLGGYDAVNRRKEWSDIGRILGYRGIPGLSNQLKYSYTRVILPYEDFCEQVRNSPLMSPASRAAQSSVISNVHPTGTSLNAAVTHAGDSSPPSSPLSSDSSPLSDPSEDGENKETGGDNGDDSHRMARNAPQEKATVVSGTSANGPSGSSSAVPAPVFHDKKDVNRPSEQNCEICHKKNHGERMLLCDGCDCGFHTYCLVPELTTIPKDQWFCHTCLVGTGGDFGFDEGEEHSLSSFQARDLAFRRSWFESHPPSAISASHDATNGCGQRYGDILVSESDIENEFWRLVQSPTETVEVEYGADVHSTTYGSAMPTLETHPLDPYSKDPWNLNNISIVSDSLLRFIKSDVSGMTVPWTYVGMLFSTFCWHNEDHYTFSINFMHWGETKTWYGIPGDCAEKFEAAIKSEAPDLFEAQPDLLFQLVTLMNPKRVKDAGVDVYACDQRAGEFVITFPKAYHAGFNHGLNFNEAVNFALHDWLPFGRECVQRYREHRKLPVFSHDELLITITQQSQSISTAMWLLDSLKEMTSRELSDRKTARSLGLAEVLDMEDRQSEEQYQCAVCKTFCYLSQVVCQCSTKAVCVEHADLLCEHSLPHLTLRKRFSDNDLLSTQSRVAERAAIPTQWRDKLDRILEDGHSPPLRALRALVAEGDRINYPLPELQVLRKFVARANEWVESANVFIVRKQSRKRARRTRGRLSSIEPMANGVDDSAEKPERGLAELYDLIRDIQDLGFDCPEIAILHAQAAKAEAARGKARAILDAPELPENDRDGFIQECERLLLDGSSLNVHIDELVDIERIVLREQLIRELEEKLEGGISPTLEEVRHLLARARACDLASDNRYLGLLQARQRAGDDWEKRATAVLNKSTKTIEELSDFANIDSTIPIEPTILDRLKSALAKAKDFEKQAKIWLQPSGGKPRVQEVLKLIGRSEKDFAIPAIQDLKRTADIAADLETRCEGVLKRKFAPTDEGDVFETMERWRAYAKEHLMMFSLPTFGRFDLQLTQHYAWIKSLPWYCDHHCALHSDGMLDDVLESTRPEDDLPPADEYFTCICTTAVRPPSAGKLSDAVQCDHCFARFHGVCAANGGSCPFCDHHHWNGSIHKERGWHFCYLPVLLHAAPDLTKNYCEEWKQMEIVVHRVDRLSAVIGQFLSFASQAGNQRLDLIPQVRHYMRKLYKIQFAVSPVPDVSFGLDLAGLHRILAGQPPVRAKKRRRPRFVFGQDADKDWLDKTRCICRGRTPYLINYPTVECDQCNKLYHAGCVFFPLESSVPSGSNRFTCPLCCLRKNRAYPYSDVRVQHIDHPEQDTYVNTKEMLDTFSREIIYIKMPPPYTQTLFVELIRFSPGQPDNVTSTGPARGNPPAVYPSGPVAPSSHYRSANSEATSHAALPPSPMSMTTTFGAGGTDPEPGSVNSVIPPPPWSRWGIVNTPNRPPATTRRQAPDSSPPQISRKRKHADDVHSSEETSAPKRPLIQAMPEPSPSIPPPSVHVLSSPPVPPSPRPIQSVSPSLARLLTPSTESSPKTAHAPYGPPKPPPPHSNGRGADSPMSESG